MKMKMPSMRNIFFCVSLRRELILLAYLNSILLLQMLVTGEMFFNPTHIGRDALSLFARFSNAFDFGLISYIGLVDFAFSMFLIYGLHTNRVEILRVYNYYRMCIILAMFIVGCIIILLRDINPNDQMLTFFIFLVIYCTWTVIQLYILVLIRNLIYVLVSKTEAQEPFDGFHVHNQLEQKSVGSV